MKKYVGKNYPIHDAWEKATGEKIYTGDMKIPGMNYGKILFSPIPFGRVKKIDTKKARELNGVIGIFTHENTPLKKYNNYFSFAGQKGVEDERLFTDVVRYVGDKVAAVVAVSPEIADEALKLIEVEYEKYESIVDIYQALSGGSSIHENGNILNDGIIKAGDVDKVLKEASDTFTTKVHVPRLHHGAMERHVCLSTYNVLGELTIWTPCQSVFAVRNAVAAFLNMSYSDVRVVKTTTGGSFGGKQQMILEIVGAYLAKEVKGPVMIEYSREASLLSTSVGTAMDFEVTTDVTEDGTVNGINYEVIADAGAYATNSQVLPMSAGRKVARLYNTKNLAYHCKSVYTNTTPAGGLRGWGGPQAYTAIEIHLDQLAKRCGTDPVSIRMKNFLEPFDKDPYSGVSFGNVHIKDCMNEGVKAFRWNERYERKKDEGRFKKGVGLGCVGHTNGYYGAVQDFANMTLKMNEDGSFILNTAVQDQGCGTLISLSIIVAEVLDVPVEKIKVKEGDSDTSPYDMGTYASRVTYVSGKCAENAALSIKKLILKYGAELLEESKDEVFIENGSVVSKVSGNKLSFSEVAVRTQLEKKFDIMVFERYVSESNPGSYGVHFAEVEVDTLTGLVKVTDYLAVHDLGCAINKAMVEGQIQGAVQAGIGCALTESVEVDSKGYPIADNFDKYTVVNFPDMPEVKTLILEYGGDNGPFEGKSIGETSLVPVSAAIVNAINNALGTDLADLPVTPKKIIKKLYDKGGV